MKPICHWESGWAQHQSGACKIIIFPLLDFNLQQKRPEAVAKALAGHHSTMSVEAFQELDRQEAQRHSSASFCNAKKIAISAARWQAALIKEHIQNPFLRFFISTTDLPHTMFHAALRIAKQMLMKPAAKVSLSPCASFFSCFFS